MGILKIRSLILVILLGVSPLIFFSGCGGKLAKTGFAAVTEVAPNGAMRMQYADGKAAWKRIAEENGPKDCAVAAKNRLKWARFVETKKGSTLTFPNGDTITYQNLDLD
jgi:hypothetical protein